VGIKNQDLTLRVFSNPGMSLKGVLRAGRFGWLLSGIFSYKTRIRRGGGNVGIGFIDFQGLWEGRKTVSSFSGLSINRHFHGPLPLLCGFMPTCLSARTWRILPV